MVTHCFKACRISSSNGGSDDGFIHCLKHGRVATVAIETIYIETVRLNSRECDGDELFGLQQQGKFEADL